MLEKSMCDTISQFNGGGDGQPMEVVEHILHHITMVGLHYTFNADWGVDKSSVQYTQMMSAIANNVYNG